MGEFNDLHPPEQEEEVVEAEEEEALSLCDLPLDKSKEGSNNMENSSHTRRPSSSSSSSDASPECFEFFSGLSCEMCSAEDIIFCGKLVPFKEHPQHSPPPQTPRTHHQPTEDDRRQLFSRRRCESLSGIQTSVSRSDSTKTKLKRCSRSLDYSKLESASLESDMQRNSSVRSVGKGDGTVKKSAKPRWYVLMFGVLKPPTEMELSDIKSRQVRRNPSTMFPVPASADAGMKPPVNRSINKGSFRLLKVLSCKDPASVAVTPSFCLPQAGG